VKLARAMMLLFFYKADLNSFDKVCGRGRIHIRSRKKENKEQTKCMEISVISGDEALSTDMSYLD
jgi:hypothetical protein